MANGVGPHGGSAIPLSWLTDEGVQADADMNNARINGVQNKYGLTPTGLAYLMNNADSYLNAYNKEQEWLREDRLREENFKREDESWDRVIESLKRNGINPALMLSNVSPVAGAYSNSTSSIGNNNYSTNAKTDQATNAKVATSIIAALAMILAAFA